MALHEPVESKSRTAAAAVDLGGIAALALATGVDVVLLINPEKSREGSGGMRESVRDK